MVIRIMQISLRDAMKIKKAMGLGRHKFNCVKPLLVKIRVEKLDTYNNINCIFQ